MSFEELRARSRGCLSRDWAVQSQQRSTKQSQLVESRAETVGSSPNPKEEFQALQNSQSTQETQSELGRTDSPDVSVGNTISIDITQESKQGRPKKTKIREVKGETQTSMP